MFGVVIEHQFCHIEFGFALPNRVSLFVYSQRVSSVPLRSLG